MSEQGETPPEETRRREAKRILDRAAGESEVFGSSTLARRIGRHFRAEDADRGDAAELWGTRIARGLALAFFAFLLFWLAGTYL